MKKMDWSIQGGDAPANYEAFLVPAMFEPFAETLVVQAGVVEGSRVLDVACGTGACSRAAARRAGPSGSVTGVDLGEPTLAVARSKPPEPGAAPIEYLQGDATQLPVADAAFDVALCQHGLQFVPDKLAAVAEMRRALKPGGQLGIATWTSVESAPFGALVEALRNHLDDDAASVMKSPFVVAAAELERLIAEAAFHDVEVRVEEMECTWASPPGEFADRAIACGPLAPRYAQAPEAARRAVAAEVEERLAPFATADGAVRMPMVSHVALART
jgi:2-polyprenyl-3-methyl-5-hydroxy-6-metoxy-1,4-benzoquinol methylase